MAESLEELELRLQLLKKYNVAAHDPSNGQVTFFATRPEPKPVTKEEMLESEAKREAEKTEIEWRRKFGAAGGYQPGQLSADEITARQRQEADDAARFSRQAEKVRKARAELDKKAGSLDG